MRFFQECLKIRAYRCVFVTGAMPIAMEAISIVIQHWIMPSNHTRHSMRVEKMERVLIHRMRVFRWWRRWLERASTSTAVAVGYYRPLMDVLKYFLIHGSSLVVCEQCHGSTLRYYTLEEVCDFGCSEMCLFDV